MSFFGLMMKPGVLRDQTRYSGEGTWFDCDKIRFRGGLPEKFRGWEKLASGDYLGFSRRIHDWSTIGGAKYVAVGTHVKLYINSGDDFYDITPVRTTTALGTDPISTTDGTGLISIEDVGHGAVLGDYVTIAGASTTNGIPDTDINQEHKIVGVPDDDTIQIVVATAATSTGSGGGSSITCEYEINVGLKDYVSASGWGAGSWGSGTWSGSSALGADAQLRLWSFDNFGDDLLANARGGGIFYWDQSDGTATPAIKLDELTRRSVTLGSAPIATTNLSAIITVTDNGGHGAGVGDLVTLSGAVDVGGIVAADINTEHTILSTPTDTTFTVEVANAATSTATGGGSAVEAAYNAGTFYTPIKGLQVLVSDVARHVLVFGTNAIGEADLDPLFVRWCTSENPAEWQPSETNTAGGQRLSAGSEFIGAIRTRHEILAWTDAGITSIRYVGGDFVFSFTEAATGVSMISPNAAVVANGVVYFMDRGHFHVYSGYVQTLPCSVHQHVFPRIDFTQAHKIFGGSNETYSEIMWFYPSTDGNGEIDSYVVLNYDENLWAFGSLARGHWSNAYTVSNPVSTGLRYAYLGESPISTTSASQTITVTHESHGLSVGDTIIIEGASSVGGIDEKILNDQHAIASVVSDDSYTITVPDSASSTATGGGGDETVLVFMPNYLYVHNVGHDDDGQPMNAYIESADMDIGEGDKYWFIDKIIPDVQFIDSQDVEDAVTITLKGHNYPGQDQSTLATASVTATTEQSHVRARARQVVYRVESTGSGYGWRLGKTRLNARPDGRQ